MQEKDDVEEEDEPQVYDNTNIEKNKVTQQIKAKTTSAVGRKGAKEKENSKTPITEKANPKGGRSGSVEKKVVNQDPKILYGDKYSKFMTTLAPLLGVRGKKLNLFNLKYIIEEIYSIRFIKDTTNLRNQLVKQKKSSGEEDKKDPFPIFCVEFLVNKHVKKNLVDQHGLDLLISADFYKTQYKEIEIFHKFLNEEFDTDDLIFFLFVRSCIEKEMKMMFIEKSREEMKTQYNENKEDNEVYLNVKNCLKIANTIFGNEEEVLLNSFMEKIEKNLITSQKKGKNLIRASTILEITLEDYHESRKLYGQTSNMNFENFKKKDLGNNDIDDYENKEGDIKENKKSNQNNKQQPNQQMNTNQSKDKGKANTQNREEKINYLKKVLNDFIKDKEIDNFFETTMQSYNYTEKENELINKTIANIKDLVVKKISVLISILFSKDKEKWYTSLQIKDPKEENETHFNNIMKDIDRLVDTDVTNLQENVIESLGISLISTKELISQINNLIFKYLK